MVMIAMKQEIITDKAPGPGGSYSQGLKVGNRVYVAGQTPKSPETGEIVGTTISEQTHQVLQNIEAVLVAAGASLDDVVKATCHLSDNNDFSAFNAVYEQYFKVPRPVRTTVQSGLKGILVEIDVIAEISGESV